MMMDRSGMELPASSLSDGTMRFVALAILELDPTEQGVVCLEEPENGIHPERINAILDLLYRIATDTHLSAGHDNPLRQVIITTHSPLIVGRVKADDLIFLQTRHHGAKSSRHSGVEISALPESWRCRLGKTASMARGQILTYLRGPGPSYSVPDDLTVAASIGEQLQLPI
jgi:predicted ATPase